MTTKRGSPAQEPQENKDLKEVTKVTDAPEDEELSTKKTATKRTSKPKAKLTKHEPTSKSSSSDASVSSDVGVSSEADAGAGAIAMPDDSSSQSDLGEQSQAVPPKKTSSTKAKSKAKAKTSKSAAKGKLATQEPNDAKSLEAEAEAEAESLPNEAQAGVVMAESSEIQGEAVGEAQGEAVGEAVGKGKGKGKGGSKAKKSKKGGAGEDLVASNEVMEEHANRALDFNAPVLLVPIRHHSFAMGLHLTRIIDAYQPDFIAVEMPYVCQDQVKHLANDKVVPPIAFFSYGTTKTIQLVPIDEEDPESGLKEEEVEVGFRHIYPMLSHSPEYVALREAIKRNIDYQCIDLSSCEKDYIDSYLQKLAAQKILEHNANKVQDNELEASNQSSLDSRAKEVSKDEEEFSRSDYFQKLVENSGDLSFEEFWDRNFEVNALASDTKTFLHNVYTYCYCIRKDISDEQDIAMVQRELYMLKQINAAQKKYQRILVLTGGMHSVALCDYLYYKKKKEKPFKFPKTKDNCFLVPYSFRSTDVQSEYASGIVFPYYYHKLYQAISNSMSFAPSTTLLGNETDGYKAQACDSEGFRYWDNPLSVICNLDKKIHDAWLLDDEDEEDLSNLTPDQLKAKRKAKRKALKSSTVTSSGRLVEVVSTIKQLGSIKEQAKIKNSEDFSAKVVELKNSAAKGAQAKAKAKACEPNGNIQALATSAQEAKSAQGALGEQEGTGLVQVGPYNALQREALLTFKANKEQLINACDANNFYFASQILDYRQNKMSTALHVDCQVMLKGLASLRDKFAPSVHELIDAVKSTFIKEEYNESHYILVNLLKALTTVPLGKVPLDVNVPPIWRDFVYKAKTFGLKTEDQDTHKANIDIFKDEKNVLKGRFFAQVSFLCPSFEIDQYSRYNNVNYIKRTETYTYRYSDDVVMSIVEAAEYGDTLELACEAKVKERLEQSTMGLTDLCKLFKDCVDMGIERQYRSLKDLIANTINNERDLLEISASLDLLNSYSLIAKTTKSNKKIVDSLTHSVLKRALKVISSLVDVSDEELDNYLESLLKLNYYFNKYEFITKQYYQKLNELSEDNSIAASLQGAYVSLLFKNKQISYDEFERFVDQFVYGSIIENNDCIGFFYSILKISKASIFYRNGILQLLNAYIASLQGEEFLKVLVMLRRSFASFSKDEVYKVVALLQKIHGIAQTKYIFEVTDEEFVQNRIYDKEMLAKMSNWLPVAKILEQANLHKEQIASTSLVEDLTGQDLSRSSLLSQITSSPQSSAGATQGATLSASASASGHCEDIIEDDLSDDSLVLQEDSL